MQNRNRITGIAVCISLVAFFSGTVLAAPTTLVDERIDGPVGVYPSFPHSYQHDVTGDPAYDPSLDVDSGELTVWLSDTYFGTPYSVTTLYDGTSWSPCVVNYGTYCINVAPGDIVGGCMPVQVLIANSGCTFPQAFLHHSSLTLWCDCPGGVPAVPAPGAILLAGIGAGFVGWLRRRHSL